MNFKEGSRSERSAIAEFESLVASDEGFKKLIEGRKTIKVKIWGQLPESAIIAPE